MNLSIVVTIYNEQESIPELMERIVAACCHLSPYEIIAVDDGSTDRTPDILAAQKQRFPEIKIIRIQSNAGKSAALDAGFKVAQGDLVATIDADLQNPPEEIPKLLKALGSHSVANGRRLKRADTFLKKIASRIANGTRRTLLRDNSYDTGCGLKVFRKKVIDEITMYTMYKGMHRFLPALIRIKGFSMIEIEVQDHFRKYGHSKFGNFSRGLPGFFDMLAVYWMSKRTLSYNIVQGETHER